MKTLFSYATVAALIIFSSFTINQQHQLNNQPGPGGNCFNFFRAHRQAKNIAMTWAVNAGDVAGFVVERSYDGDFYESAGTINFNGSGSYKFTDVSVYPGVIYYRIRAVKQDGTTENSSVESVRIVQHG